VIILGIVCLILGFLLGISILWTIGIILVVIGVVLALVGATGHAVRDVDRDLRAASDRLADAEHRLDYEAAATCTADVDRLLDERAELNHQDTP
jgi:uncharacterized membrane protein